jgi:AAA15 family ATPase/GTPase
MSNQHIENLKIVNFKCFKELEVSNIGKVNLIGGKNNVGKTAFLEAVELLYFSDKGDDLGFSIKRILSRRQQKINIFELQLDIFYCNKEVIKIIHQTKSVQIKYETEVGIDSRYSLSLDVNKGLINNSALVALHRFTKPTDNYYDLSNIEIHYIPSSKIAEDNMAIFLGRLIDFKKEKFLNESLGFFDDNILSLKQIVNLNGLNLKLELKSQENLVLLSSLGEGINRYIAILCAIWASKDGVLLIDEIENGIHYTNYKKLWQIIFQASVDANCQLFITTHSKECISAFNDVQLDNNYDACNSQYFEFYRNMKKDGIISASQRNKEQLQYSLSHNGRIRGE